MATQATTEQLILSTTAGDGVALRDLLVRTLPEVRAFVRLQLGPRLRARETSSDLVQSVCAEVLADLSTFDYRGVHAFKGWLFRRVLNKIRAKADFHGAARRSPARELAATAIDQELMRCYRTLSPSQHAMRHEDVARLEAAFDELTDEQREAIVLHRLIGMSQAEVGDALGKSEAAVRNLVFRGLARL
ncbi:MAG: sigma-70 family RNA polymerase sigma factor, partial [Planctomycetes bacterium]|nr:sigma-70 family RNA polymerase sigma factor [Planctomycetota bacterium]